MRGRGIALSLTIAAAACAHGPPAGERDPSGAGRAWREYRSAHFVVDTNLPRGAAAELVRTLERLRELELRALRREPREVPGPLRVVVPATPGAYAELAPPFSSGYFTLGWLVVPTIVVPARALGRAPEVVAHELAHALSRFLFPGAPAWFDEGLAQFVETVANPDPRYERTAGLAPRLAGSRLAEATPVPARELLAWAGELDHAEADRHHVYSWLLFHFLWNERSGAFAELRRRLSEAEDPRAAWRAAFPEFDPEAPGALERLDAALEDHRRKEAAVGPQLPAAPVDASFTEAPLGPADVRMLLLEVRSDSRTAVAREVKEALRQDATQPFALFFAEQESPERRKAALRASAATRRSDWRAWLLLARELDADAERAEKENALREAIALHPGSALAHDGLARVLVASGRAEEALPIARRAVALAPFVPAFVETLAHAALERGDCREALALQRRAAAMAKDAAASRSATALRAYEERCGTAGGGDGGGG